VGAVRFRQARFVMPLIADTLLHFAYAVFVIAFILPITQTGKTSKLAIHVFGISQVGYLCSVVIGGYLTSKFGFKKMIIVAMLFYSVIPISVYYCLGYRDAIYLLACFSGICAGLSTPAAKVQLYDLIPREKRGIVYLALYILSLLSAVGYYVGHVLYLTNKSAPFWLSSFLVFVATMIFWVAPSEKVICEREHQLNLGKLVYLLRVYISDKFIMVISLICLFVAGNSLFYFAGVFRMLSGGNAGRNISIVMVAIFVMAIISQSLRKAIQNKPMVLTLSVIPVLSIAAAFGYENRLILMLLWTLFMGCSMNARISIFAFLHKFLDVKSGIHMSLYLLAASLGSLLSYGILVGTTIYFELRWVFVGYAMLFCFALYIFLKKNYLAEIPVSSDFKRDYNRDLLSVQRKESGDDHTV
jgi:MFS family permease